MSRVALTETVLLATNPVSFARGADVFVYKRGTKEEATLYAAESGGSPISQPLTTDVGGRPLGAGEALAWVAPGSYDLYVNGETIPWEAGGGIEPVPAVETINKVGNAGEAQTVDLAKGRIITMTLNKAVCALTMPTEIAGDRGFTIYPTQDGTGGRKFSLPANFRWSGGFEQQLSTAPGAEDELLVTPAADGEHWIGSIPNKALGAAGGSETVAPAAQAAIDTKDIVQGLPGLIIPCGYPLRATTVETTENRAWCIRFVWPKANTLAKGLNFVVSTNSGANDNCCGALLAANGKTVLATSGSQAGKLNAGATPVRNVTFVTPYEMVRGTTYYGCLQQGPVGGTKASFAAAGWAGSGISTIVGTAAGTILLAFAAPTFPFASEPGIENAPIEAAPVLFVKTT